MNITLYAYLDITHPFVAWEVAIGRIKSVDDNNPEGFGISQWQYSLLSEYVNHGLNQRFINELMLEHIRQKCYPQRVSRLQGVYFFESEEDANNALDRWNMPYKKKYISAVKFSANKLTKVDSEWITNKFFSTSDIRWMNRYWEGEVYGEAPLYEILASGIGVILNYDLRIEAYKRIINLWPESTFLLAMACCSFKVYKMEEIALLRPAIIAKNDKIIGSYFIKMSDLDTKENQEKAAHAMEICKKNNELPPFILPKNPEAIWRIPDLRQYIFIFDNPLASNILSAVHDFNCSHNSQKD